MNCILQQKYHPEIHTKYKEDVQRIHVEIVPKSRDILLSEYFEIVEKHDKFMMVKCKSCMQVMREEMTIYPVCSNSQRHLEVG